MKREFKMMVPGDALDRLPIQMCITLSYADWLRIEKALDETDQDHWKAEKETARQIKELLGQFVGAVEPYKYTFEDDDE